MRIKGKGKSILTRQRLPVLGSLFTGLLDEVSGAAAAYSIRLLRADYSGGLVRVRAVNSSGVDQGEADVLPDSNNEISLSSELTNRDSTAGSSGRGVSTLGELVTNSSGTDYDGFVSEWKDQTPNARHATNSTASEQPQLVDAGNLITENGKPALDSRNRSCKLLTANTATWLNNTKHTFVSVTRFLTDDSLDIICGTNSSNDNEGLHVGKRDSNILTIAHFGDDGDINYSVDGTQDLFLAYGDYSGSEFFIDGVQKAAAGAPQTELNTSAAFTLFEGAGSSSIRHGGTIQEVVVYTDNDRSKQSTLKTNINGFYQIPNF